MKKEAYTLFYKYAALVLILGFATVQFFLILRHKSPYLSDSYFYKHVYYEIKGSDFIIARKLVLSEIDLSKEDEIGKNIFLDESVYKEALGFFTKRPLYPLAASTLSFITSEYYSFLIPVFFSYLGVISASYYFFKNRLKYSLAIIGTALFISFYPLLDWSTYFLTDTIGAAFWLFQLLLATKFITTGKPKWLLFFGLSLPLSLFNREQTILMAPLFLVLQLGSHIFQIPFQEKRNIQILLVISILAAIVYICTSYITQSKNIIDTIIYTQNKYGLTDRSFNTEESVNYIWSSVKTAHLVFAKDLASHHWWSTFVILALLGLIRSLTTKRRRILDLVMFSSAVASYSAIFIYPVPSYRYFFPLVISVVYFAMIFVENFFQKRENFDF